MATLLEDKLKQKQRKGLVNLCSSAKSAWSFQNKRTWHLIYKHLGFDEMAINQGEMALNKDKPVSFEELKTYLKSLEDDLERKLNEPQNKVQEESVRGVVEVNGSQPILTEQSKPSALVTEALKDIEHKEQEGFNSSNDYGLPECHWKATHFWFQKKAIKELLDKVLGFDVGPYKTIEELKIAYKDSSVVKKPKTGVLLLSGTGTGKSYMLAGLVHVLLYIEYEYMKTFSHIPYLYIGKTTILPQISRVFKTGYNIRANVDVEVINIEQLRSGAGEFWVKNEVKMQGGEEVDDWKWKKGIQPCVVLFDESQGAKNSGSTQTKIIYAYNNIPTNACLVSISATPFTRVSEAQAFAVSTHRPLDHLGFPHGTVLTNDNWPTYAAQIAAPADPEDYNQAAIERLMKDLEPWVVRVRGVKPQFNAKNEVKVIPFEDEEKRISMKQHGTLP